MEHKEASLANLNQGHIAELFNEAWRKVMENIADENTPPNSARVINIKIEVKPNEAREFASTKVSSTIKLAPVKPSEGVVLFSYDGVKATAYVNDPKQEELPLPDNKSAFRPAVGDK